VNRSAEVIRDERVICPQARGSWESTAIQFYPQYIRGLHYNISENGTAQSTPIFSGTSEDCLFLDVVVPRRIFETAGKGPGSPVLGELHPLPSAYNDVSVQYR
jgi:hypothetical protein